jgi:branched-chain amino acid transport system substrate-binding protein
MGQKSGNAAQRVALVYENTDWGQSAAAAWKVDLAKAGMNIVLDSPYPATSSDLTPVILKIKEAKPDLILFTSYTSDAILLTNGIAQMKINTLGMIGGGGGHADPEYMKNTGKNSEYHFDLVEWSTDIAKPGVKEENDKFNAAYGVDMNGESANCYASMYVLADALERAGVNEPEKIRDALSTTDLSTGNAMILPCTSIKFDETGQNINASLLMIQIRDGQRVTVWPAAAKNAAFDAVWPTPTWESRK